MPRAPQQASQGACTSVYTGHMHTNTPCGRPTAQDAAAAAIIALNNACRLQRRQASSVTASSPPSALHPDWLCCVNVWVGRQIQEALQRIERAHARRTEGAAKHDKPPVPLFDSTNRAAPQPTQDIGPEQDTV
eukprot:221081-Rhodomonas_salina.2